MLLFGFVFARLFAFKLAFTFKLTFTFVFVFVCKLYIPHLSAISDNSV